MRAGEPETKTKRVATETSGPFFMDRTDPRAKKPLPGDGERLSDFAGGKVQKLTFAPTNQLRGSDGP